MAIGITEVDVNNDKIMNVIKVLAQALFREICVTVTDHQISSRANSDLVGHMTR